MNLLWITLIGCVIYFSEYRATKKAVVVAVILVIMSMCLGVTEGFECDKWYEGKCDNCGDSCGWLWGIGCLFKDCGKLKGEASSSACKCSNGDGCIQGQTCPDMKKCDCPGDATCSNELTALCGQEKKGTPCDVCVDRHQDEARNAGCSSEDAGEFCEIPDPPPSGGDVDINDQASETVQIVNKTSERPLSVFLAYSSPNLKVPPSPWTVSKSNNATLVDNSGKAYDGDIGGGETMWQRVDLNENGWIILGIPGFPPQQAWSIRPLKKGGDWCSWGKRNGNKDREQPSQRVDCGWPILFETGKDMVGDMSAVDGVNFLLTSEMTNEFGTITTTPFTKNPCPAQVDTSAEQPDAGNRFKNTCQGGKCGCRNLLKADCHDTVLNKDLTSGWGTAKRGPLPNNPADGTPGCDTSTNTKARDNGGLFKPDTNAWSFSNDNDECYHGTCNLLGIYKKWADDIHTGQCVSSSDHWNGTDSKSSGCTASNGTQGATYSYDFDDQNASPHFGGEYKIKLVYSDITP